MRYLTGFLLVAVLAGCAGSSSGVTTQNPPAVSDTTGANLPPTPAAPSGHPKTACAAFRYFYTDLTTYTPHAGELLTADAERVQQLAVNGSRRLFDDASSLTAFVGSSSWSSSGNVLSPPVQRMMADCGM